MLSKQTLFESKNSKPTTPTKKSSIPLENSFILFSHVSPKFLAEMKVIVSEATKEVLWLESLPTDINPHLTIVHSHEDKEQKLAADEIEKIKQSAATKIDLLLEKGVKRSFFLLPHNILIAPTGWVILELCESKLESLCAEESLSLDKLHASAVDILENKSYKQKFNPKFIREGYKPHVTIGKVKTTLADGKPSAEEIESAIKDLTKNQSVMLKKFIDKLPPLNLFDFEFINNLTPDKALSKKIIPRRDFNIKSIIVENKEDKIYLQFDSEESAKSCSAFLYSWGIYCQDQKGRPILPVFHEKQAVLKLTIHQYTSIAGIIENCHPLTGNECSYKKEELKCSSGMTLS